MQLRCLPQESYLSGLYSERQNGKKSNSAVPESLTHFHFFHVAAPGFSVLMRLDESIYRMAPGFFHDEFTSVGAVV